jgi:TolB-like protein
MRLADIAVPGRIFAEPPQGPPSPEAVRAQLARLRAQAFASSAKLFGFLHFVVEEALAGRAATLKELVIGIELYGSIVDYDPRIDSTVRVEARRLRRKLEAYYAGPGRDDAVVISIPTGGYAPCLRLRRAGEGAVVDLPRAVASRPMLAVLPFTALCTGETGFAAGVTDELISAAERAAQLRVAPRAIMFQFREGRYSLDEVATQAGSDLVLHGTIRQAQDVRRVSVELYNRWGQILWSDRVDSPDAGGDGDLDAQERIAAEIVDRLPAAMMRELAVVGTV